MAKNRFFRGITFYDQIYLKPVSLHSGSYIGSTNALIKYFTNTPNHATLASDMRKLCLKQTETKEMTNDS